MVADLFEKIGFDKLAVMLTDQFGSKVGGAMVKIALVILWLALVATALMVVSGMALTVYGGWSSMQHPRSTGEFSGKISAPSTTLMNTVAPTTEAPESGSKKRPVHSPRAKSNDKPVVAKSAQQPPPAQSSCNVRGSVNDGTSQNCSFGDPAPVRTCAPGANCSQNQSGGVSIGTINH